MKVTRSQLIKVGWITVAWTIISIFKFLIAYGALAEYGFVHQVNLKIPFAASIITGILAGTIGGSATVFLWERWLRSKPYGWTIRNTLLSYVLIFVVVSFFTTLFFQSKLLGLPFYDIEVIGNTLQRMLSPPTLVPFFTWLAFPPSQ